MRLEKYKDKYYQLYTVEEAHNSGIAYKKDWRNAEEGNYVLTDDNMVVPVLKIKRIGKDRAIQTPTGLFNIDRANTKLDTKHRANKTSFTSKPPSQVIRDRKNANNREIMFVKYFIETGDRVEAYLRAFKTRNIEIAKIQGANLLKQKRIVNMIIDEVKLACKNLGVNYEYVIKGFKEIYEDTGQKGADRLRALENLGNIINATDKASVLSGNEGYTGGRLSGGEERKGIPNMAEIPAEEIENILDDVPEEEIIESGL